MVPEEEHFGGRVIWRCAGQDSWSVFCFVSAGCGRMVGGLGRGEVDNDWTPARSQFASWWLCSELQTDLTTAGIIHFT